MMLVDNLIHSDLHPGNILVRLNPPKGFLGLVYRLLDLCQDIDQVCEKGRQGGRLSYFINDMTSYVCNMCTQNYS